MAKKLRLTLRYSYNESWIGGTYYIQNLLNSLKKLNDTDRPFLNIYALPKDCESLQKLDYPDLSFHHAEMKYSLFERIINKLWRTFFHVNFFEKLPNPDNTDILFPIHLDYFSSLMPVEQTIFWIPDFQERHLPMLFSEEELQRRKNWQSKIAEMKTNVLFSSQDALNDFKTFYPQSRCRLFVVPFTVSHPDFQDISIEDLRIKYGIKGEYFFSPNQFWKHKNHQVVLDALLILKQNGLKTQVIFTGKEEDYRNPDYFPSLMRFVKENDLSENVKFLGFIDRREQLQLMKNSFAVIQPSLFEGWSTVVEDAKALNQFIILSNLPVHIEQIQKNVCFFDPKNAEELAKKITFFSNNPPEIEIIPYNKDAFGNGFLKMLNFVKNT